LQTKTPHNFHLTNQNGMIQSFLHTQKCRKPIKNFVFEKNDFSNLLGFPNKLMKKDTYYTINFDPCSQKLWKLLGLKKKPCPRIVWKFQKIKVKIPFVVSCPKLLCKLPKNIA